MLKDIAQKPGRIYAIGDIHGCSEELFHLLRALDNDEGLNSDDHVVFIGDYIDRGYDSSGTISLLLDFQKSFKNCIFLCGNHEDMFRSFLGYEGTQGGVFVKNGGDKTLNSYGINEDADQEQVLQQIPNIHLQFLNSLIPYARIGTYLFAHAGVSPIRSLKDQVTDDLYWIREEFIMNRHNLEHIVIFGHTPYKSILFHLPYKIGIDTGLVYGNYLTCIELTAGKIMQIKFNEDTVRYSDFPKRNRNPGSPIAS